MQFISKLVWDLNTQSICQEIFLLLPDRFFCFGFFSSRIQCGVCTISGCSSSSRHSIFLADGRKKKRPYGNRQSFIKHFPPNMYAFQHLPLPANSIRNSWRCSMQFMRPKKCPLSENVVQIFPFSFFALSLFIFIRLWEFYGVMIWICSGFWMLKISVFLHSVKRSKKRRSKR